MNRIGSYRFELLKIQHGGRPLLKNCLNCFNAMFMRPFKLLKNGWMSQTHAGNGRR